MSRVTRLEGALYVANILLLLFGFFGTSLALPRWEVTPLIRRMDAATDQRLSELENALARNPGELSSAREVARIWHLLGQPGWSYTALLEAERNGVREPRARLSLAAAYLDIGELDDAGRVLAEASQLCLAVTCDPTLRFKLDLFRDVMMELAKDGIDPRSEPAFLMKAYQRVIKRVEVSKALGKREAAGTTVELRELR